MSKASGTFGKIVVWFLVVLLVLGITAVALFFVMREKGITYYVEYNGEKYLAGSDGGSLWLPPNEKYTFSVKSLTGGEVNYTVKITSNKANNLMFTVGDELWYLWNDNAEKDDYTEVFGLQKQTDGFSLTIPEDFTVEKAIETKYNADIELQDELHNDLCYFVITVSVDKTAVNLWFSFNELTVTLNPPQIIF